MPECQPLRYPITTSKTNIKNTFNSTFLSKNTFLKKLIT